ncbi:extracellular solute-binding protein [Aeromonas enteropelogenes]|uniref:extracellular solute-binding protein n=1 Tax=Aeromonas enteropelogenes TaxID=29489 RepID=UPI003B9FAA5C
MNKSTLGLLLLSCWTALPIAANTTEVTIAGWGGNDVVVVNKLVSEVMVDELKRAGITVKYLPIEGDFSQYIINSLSANTAPDAFYIDTVFATPLINSGKVAAIGPSLKILSESIIPNLNQAFSAGKLYGIAKDFNTLALLYNKDVFDDAKVAYPTDDDNWDQLREKLLAVQAALGTEVSGICIIPDYNRFAPFALATGWKPFNENGKTILDANFERAFTFYTGLVTKDKVGILSTDLGQIWSGGCFATEKTAITFEGNWISGYLRDNANNLLYGTTLMPKDPVSGQRGNLLFSVAWGLNANSKNMAATEKAVKILTSKKAQEWVLDSGLALPSRQDLANSAYFSKIDPSNQLAKKIFDGASRGYIEPYAFDEYGLAWSTPINEALTAVLLGPMEPAQAIKIAQKKYDAMAEKRSMK